MDRENIEQVIEAIETLSNEQSLGRLSNVLYHCFTASPPDNVNVPSTYVGSGVADELRSIAGAIQSLANEKAIANMLEMERYRREHPYGYSVFSEFLNKQKISENWPAEYSSYSYCRYAPNQYEKQPPSTETDNDD